MPVVAAVGGFLGSAAGAATIGAAGAIGSTLLANKGQKDAAKTVVSATEQANDTELNIFNKQVELQEPWRQAGIGALGQLTQLTQPGFDVQGWLSSQPGYKFGLDQGMNAIAQNKAYSGLLNSGSAFKAGNAFAQDYAGTKFNDAWNRLSGLAGTGQIATNQLGQAGQNYANQFGRNALAGAGAQANGQVNSGAMWGQTIGNLGGVAANYLNNRYGQPTYSYPNMANSGGAGVLNGLF